LAASMS